VPLSSLQHQERRQAHFDTAIRRGKGINIFVWKKHLETLLHCWVIWKLAELPPPPHSGASFWRPILAFWRLSLAFLHVWESPNPGATQGGWLGLPSHRLSPKHKELVFCLFLLSYMTSGPFSWWYILLLTQCFFWYSLSRQVMAILFCVALKAASAAHYCM
jgi:hypothetical protein